ncbi:MAG: hypothetical protein DBX47_07450 [Clostridiales bacterium]|nr:MAG: hypothetical protein DBX47_07450 [Clostridiales bacterium]
MEKNKIGVVGLARRAGKAILGYDQICKNQNKCVLLLLASDASARTQKNIDNLGLRIINTGLTKSELGTAVGIGEAAVIGITDENFAKMFI